MFDCFQSNDGHNFWVFSIFLVKTLILFTIFNKWRKQSNLDWTMDRNIMWDAEEKKRWILKFSSQNARRWMRRSEKCYKNKSLCIACLLLDTNCSTMLGQYLVPAREKNGFYQVINASFRQGTMRLLWSFVIWTAHEPPGLTHLESWQWRSLLLLWYFRLLILQNILPNNIFCY